LSVPTPAVEKTSQLCEGDATKYGEVLLLQQYAHHHGGPSDTSQWATQARWDCYRIHADILILEKQRLALSVINFFSLCVVVVIYKTTNRKKLTTTA